MSKREGKVLSDENAAHIKKAWAHVKAVLQNAGESLDDDPGLPGPAERWARPVPRHDDGPGRRPLVRDRRGAETR